MGVPGLLEAIRYMEHLNTLKADLNSALNKDRKLTCGQLGYVSLTKKTYFYKKY